jgi:nucleotide-binding universal stress UspA family protein
MKPHFPHLPLKILLAVDGSEHSLAAAYFIRDLPLPADSDVTVVGVLTPDRTIGRAPLQVALEEARAILLSENVGAETGMLHGHPAEQLIEFANQHKPDLIVIGAKGLHATLGFLLGGVAQQVVEHTRWPVLVVRSPYEGLQRVLLVTDGSPNSQRAASYIAQFPLPQNIQLHVMHVLPPLESPETYIPARIAGMNTVPPLSSHEVEQVAICQAEAEERQGRMLLTQTANALKENQFEIVSLIRRGDAASEILKYARIHEISLIVTGSRGLSAVKGWLLGSVSRKLIYHSRCSVLVIPEHMEV